jgi:hypothetical protein
VCDRIANEQHADGYWIFPQNNMGPIYPTSCNLIMLQLDKAYLPIFQR